MSDGLIIDDPSRLSLPQRLRFLAKDVVLYGGATALSAAFGLISFPLLARHFSIEQYGLIDFFSVVATFMTTAFIFGQDSAVARFFYEYTTLPERKQLGSQSLALQCGLLILGLPVLWIVSGPLSRWLSDAGDPQTLLKLVLLQVPFLLITNFSQTILKWTFARTPFLIVTVGPTVLSVTALLAGILLFDLDSIVTVFVLLLITRAACGVLGLWFVRKWLTLPRDWRFGREMLPFAAPLGLICTVGVLMPVVERTLIVDFAGGRELGLYAAGARVAMLISLPVAAFQIAWGPFSLAIHKLPDAADTYNRVLKAFAFVILLSVVFLAAAAEPMIRLLASDRYAGASVVVFPIAMALGVQSIGWITSIGISISKRTHFSLYAYVAYGIVSASAMYVLLRAYGVLGVAWGVLLGHLCKSILETFLAQRVHPLPWAFARVLAVAACTLCVGMFLQVISLKYGLPTSLWVGAAGLGVIAVVGSQLLITRHEMVELLAWSK